MAKIYEPGTYRARATSGALGETSTGKEQVAVAFSLLDFPGESITWYGYFTEKTVESSFKALRTAGWRGQDLADLSDLAREDAPEVHLVLENEAQQLDDGTTVTRTRVRWVNGTGGMALKTALAPDKAKSFAARMRGQLAAFDAKEKAAGRTATPPPASNSNGTKPATAKPTPVNAKPPPEQPQPPLEVLDAQADSADVPY